MKTISISIPITLVRKLKAYRDITGRPQDVDTASLIETIVNEQLISLLGLGSSRPGVSVATTTSAYVTAAEDVAEGLGDVVEDSNNSDRDAVNDSSSGDRDEISDVFSGMEKRVTEASMEDDMKVEDPHKEAKADATSIRLSPEQDPEEAFDFARPASRKRRGARVTMLTEEPSDVN